jgi:hypothetical protein
MYDMKEMEMELPANTLPMMTGTGPYGPIGMGGMFTLLKVRADQKPGDYSDPGWYAQPAGTQAYEVAQAPAVSTAQAPSPSANPSGARATVRKPLDHKH